MKGLDKLQIHFSDSGVRTVLLLASKRNRLLTSQLIVKIITSSTTQMGDISGAQASDVGALDKDTPKVGDLGASTSPPPSHDESRAFPEYNPSSQPQQHSIASQHAFTAQFDMPQPPPGHRPGPYNMGPMGNALPPVAYRPVQYPPGTQQRYNPASSPPMMQQMPQYSGHPSMPVAAQGYYIQQPQMTQYYGSQMPQAQPGSTMAPRQNITYYPNQMMMSPQQSAYYYAPPPPYQPSAHPVPHTMVAGQYMNGSPGTNDPRSMMQPIETGGGQPQPPKQGQGRAMKQSRVRGELRQSPDGAERRQSAVRGPPRKPRQSGKSTCLDDSQCRLRVVFRACHLDWQSATAD